MEEQRKCQHPTNSRLIWEEVEVCLRCHFVIRPVKTPSKFSWQSIKDYWRAWWKRHVIDEYPYDDAM